MADDGDSSLVYWKSTEEEEAAQAEHETPERTRRNQVFILRGAGEWVELELTGNS
jgi:hypothetical protein